MKIFYYLIFILSFCRPSIYGQNSFIWGKTFNNGEGKSVCTDNNGNAFVTGSFDGIVDFDPGTPTYTLDGGSYSSVFILKFNSFGNFIWAKSFGGNGYDLSKGITVDYSGNIIICGDYTGLVDFDPGPGTFTANSGQTSAFVIKLDSLGNFLWADCFTNNSLVQAEGLSVDNTGNIYVTGASVGSVDFDPGPGYYSPAVLGGDDIYVCKLRPSGALAWVKLMGGSGYDTGYAITNDVYGNVISTGWFHQNGDYDPGPAYYGLSVSGVCNIYVSKLDSSGNFLWAKKLGNTQDEGSAIACDFLGNTFVTGRLGGTGDFDPGPGVYMLTSHGLDDIFVCKLDINGNFAWAKSVGGSDWDFGNGIAVSKNQKVYVTGKFGSAMDINPGVGVDSVFSNGYDDIFILTLDVNGNFLCGNNIGGPYQDVSNSISIDANENFIITGFVKDSVDFDPGPWTYYLYSGGGVFLSKMQCDVTIVTSVSESLNDHTIEFFPSPSHGIINLTCPSYFSSISISIKNLLGKEIYRGEFKNNPPSQLEVVNSSGIHFIEVTSGEHRIVRKIIIE